MRYATWIGLVEGHTKVIVEELSSGAPHKLCSHVGVRLNGRAGHVQRTRRSLFKRLGKRRLRYAQTEYRKGNWYHLFVDPVDHIHAVKLQPNALSSDESAVPQTGFAQVHCDECGFYRKLELDLDA